MIRDSYIIGRDHREGEDEEGDDSYSNVIMTLP